MEDDEDFMARLEGANDEEGHNSKVTRTSFSKKAKNMDHEEEDCNVEGSPDEDDHIINNEGAKHKINIEVTEFQNNKSKRALENSPLRSYDNTLLD